MSHYAPEGAAEVREDAMDRSFRTLRQGLLLDLAVAVILVLSTAFSSNIEWTPTYWKALGLTLAKSVLQAGVSYFYRLFVAPKTQ